jgi:hypothetical protein
MRSSDLSGALIISVQDDEGIVARRLLELVVTERWVTHNIEVRHVFNGLRHPEVMEVEDGANVTMVVTAGWKSICLPSQRTMSNQ